MLSSFCPAEGKLPFTCHACTLVDCTIFYCYFRTPWLKSKQWQLLLALAEAELEYKDEKTSSVFVNFPLTKGLPLTWGGLWHVMIWTTTPWTLPANAAIAVHAALEYVGVRYRDPNDGRTIQTVLAADLAKKVLEEHGVKEYATVGRCAGKAPEYAEYRHAFLNRSSPIVLADYVSVNDGTGLVHTAPGHGAEDYRTGQSYHIDTLCPVDAGGRFFDDGLSFHDSETGELQKDVFDKLAGKQVFAANPIVVELLRERGFLFQEATLSHSYPHCWRCKKPVIFRATSQWFIAVDHANLRERTLKIIDDEVHWIPEWGKARIASMVAQRPDWCVSRQRAWGVPIPAFECQGCSRKGFSQRRAFVSSAICARKGSAFGLSRIRRN